MNVRRSLNSALRSTPDLTSPEIQAFISGGSPEAPALQPTMQASGQPVDSTIDLVRIATEPKGPEATEVKTKRSSRAQTSSQPLHSKVTISVTTRLEQRTADALRRAHLQQKLKGSQPETQQEIIQIAVQAWLREHDYLD
jgi:hypothetical protein